MPVLASSTGDLPAWVQLEALAEDAQRAIDALATVDWELSLLICDDAFIRPLNAQWRGKDAATDVLSFPQLAIEDPGAPPLDQGTLLGDVVISFETAAEQAAARGHAPAVELRVLLVHGLCHLLGHTHGEQEDRDQMQAAERVLLAALGLDAVGLVDRARADSEAEG